MAMNYFSDFLGLFFLGALWSYFSMVVFDGVIGLKDYLNKR